MSILNSVPDQGSLEASAFPETGSQPSGIEQFSKEGRNAAGTASTNRATEGATVILEQGDMVTTETGIGVGTVFNTKASSGLYNAGKMIKMIDAVREEAKSLTPSLKIDTTYQHGEYKITKLSPKEEG